MPFREAYNPELSSVKVKQKTYRDVTYDGVYFAHLLLSV